MIRLTKKEIIEAINSRANKRNKLISLNDDRMSEFKASNEAQLKKMVRELKKRMTWVQGVVVISFGDEDWQALMKEVE